MPCWPALQVRCVRESGVAQARSTGARAWMPAEGIFTRMKVGRFAWRLPLNKVVPRLASACH